LYGATVGKLAFLGVTAATNQAVCAITPPDFLSNKYLYHVLFFRKGELLDKRIGGAQPNISQTILREVQFPLPPLPEQLRIVAKIEELFSDLDAGITSLRKAKEQLKTYRQSVLKWAFEGKLTEDWREKIKPEPARIFINKISKFRNEWVIAEGKNGNSEARRILAKIAKLNNSKQRPTGSFPDGWEQRTLLEYCLVVVDCHNKTAPYTHGGIHLIRTTDIRDGKLFLEQTRFVSKNTYEYWARRCPPSAGDVLLTREAPMGEAAIVPDNVVVCMGQRMMLLRPVSELSNPKYLLYALYSPLIKQQIDKKAMGTGVQHLRVGDVETILIPVPSEEEQSAIVSEIESRLSVADNLEKTIETSITQAAALRQSILKRAFEGKLVPQDPNDEPAEKLLKRIKAEKEPALNASPVKRLRKGRN